MIGQTSEITAGIDGKVSLDEMREFLLGFPTLARNDSAAPRHQGLAQYATAPGPSR